MSATETPPSFRITEMMLGLWVPQALHTAAVLGVADVMGAEPRTSEAIAEDE